MKVRLFIAIEINEEIRKKLAEFQNVLKKSDADVGWVAPENLHATLKFIGSIDDGQVGAIVSVLKETASRIKPFDLDYTGVGVFPTEKNPRIVFADIIDAAGVLASLHEKLDNRLIALGVEHEDRKFVAHLTLGRIRSRRNVTKLIEKLLTFRVDHFGVAHVSQIVLKKSDLSPDGPTYTLLHSVEVGAKYFPGQDPGSIS